MSASAQDMKDMNSGAAGNGQGQNQGQGQGQGQGSSEGADQGGKYQWTDGWRQQLAANDEKEVKRLERFNSPEDIYRSYRALEQRMSSGELRSVLPKDAKPEELAKWRTENGVPEAPDKYDLKFENGLVVGEEDKPIIDGFLKVAHGRNYTNEQVKDAVAWYYGEVDRQAEERNQQDQQATQKAQDELRAKWGNDYRGNMNRIHAMLDTAPQGVKEEFLAGRLADGTPIGSSTKMLEYMAHLARQINPVATVVPGAGGNITGAIEDEIGKIEKVMRENRSAYNKDEKMQSRYRELLDARSRLGDKK